MKRLLLSLFCLAAFCGPLLSVTAEEKDLERKARRFYTYYYLNHYDDMWEVFHTTLREKLHDDKRAYVRSLRDSDLELHDAVIDRVQVRGDRGVVEVDLVFFFREVGKPIPRRHRMHWVREGRKWWYAGSEVLGESQPLRGEVAGRDSGREPEPARAPVAEAQPPEPDEERTVVLAAPEEPAPETAPEPDTAPAPVPGAEPPTPAATREERPAHPAEPPTGLPETPPSPSGEHAGPTGLPEELPEPEAAPEVPGRMGSELVRQLNRLGMINREAKLRRIAARLQKENLPDLVAAMGSADFPVREWCVAQIGRLALRHPELEEVVVSVLTGVIHAVEDTGLRAGAAEALGVVASPAGREPLEDLLLEGNDVQRVAAARSLRTLSEPESVPFLYATWKRSRNSAVRQACLEALGAIADEEAAGYLADIAADFTEDLEVRIQALRGLAVSAPAGQQESIDGLYRLYFDADSRTLSWRPRLLLIAALFRLEDPRASGYLGDLREETPKTRTSAEGRILGRILAAREDLDTARDLLASSRAAIRYPGAVAVAEMAVDGNADAAAAARDAARSESNTLILRTLRSADRD